MLLLLLLRCCNCELDLASFSLVPSSTYDVYWVIEVRSEVRVPGSTSMLAGEVRLPNPNLGWGSVGALVGSEVGVGSSPTRDLALP